MMDIESGILLPGGIPQALLGMAMRELPRRGIKAVRVNWKGFEVTEKPSLTDAPDFFTSADIAAQKVYTDFLPRGFPGYGIVCEEGNWRRPCTVPGCNTFFTVDGMDGTKAFERRESSGIATMIAWVHDGKVRSATVGDVQTQEMYYLSVASGKVYRIREMDDYERLITVERRPLSEQIILLREDSLDCEEAVQKFSRPVVHGGAFKARQSSSGSIGLAMARLWKGEAGAMVRASRPGAPWDMCPIMGINEALGFIQVKFDGKEYVEVPYVHSSEILPAQGETVILHRSSLGELNDWISRN